MSDIAEASITLRPDTEQAMKDLAEVTLAVDELTAKVKALQSQLSQVCGQWRALVKGVRL